MSAYTTIYRTRTCTSICYAYAGRKALAAEFERSVPFFAAAAVVAVAAVANF